MKCPECHFENPADSKFCKECGKHLVLSEDISVSHTKTILNPAKELTMGAIFAGRYKLIRELGRGGMGVVYKAEDTKLKRTVALKFLPPEITHLSEVKERFMREAQAAAALDHPNICTVYEFDETEEKNFISMAYIEGQNLKKKIESGPLELDEALKIATQVVGGLREAHKKGVIHRDIKSANIMVTEEDQAKIMDFGLARVAGGTLVTKEGTTMGTIAYMSPEQARGEEVDHKTDIWALGVVLYETLTGRIPFKADNEQVVLRMILSSKPEPITSLRTGIPLELERIVNKCLEKESAKRYKEMDELMDDISVLKKTLEPTIPAKALRIKAKGKLYKSIFTNPKLIAAASLLFVLAMAYLLFKPQSDFTSYERAFFETRYEDALNKSKSKRALDNVKAHYYYLYSTDRVNDKFPEDVKKEYQLLLESNPDSPEAHLYLGIVYLKNSYRWRSERDDAWTLINKAEKLGLSNLYVALAKLDLLSLLSVADDLLEISDRLAEEYPENPRVLKRVADVFLYEAYDEAKASQYYKACLDIFPKHVWACLRLSSIELDNNNLKTAKVYIDRANEINSEFHYVVREYARFYEREGRFDKAEECLLKAINEFGKNDVYYYNSLADIYMKQDRIEEGLNIVNKALKKFPRDRNLVFLLQDFKTRDHWLKTEAERVKSKRLIKWHEDFDEAVEIGKRENKPLLGDFYATWSSWCKMLNDKIYPDPSVQKELSSFIPVKINAEIDIKIAKKYEIDSYPTLLVIADDGEQVYEILWYEEPREFIKSLKEGMAAYERHIRGKSITPERLTEVSNLNDAKILAESKKIPIMVIVSSEESKWSEKLFTETITHPSFRSEFTDIVYLKLDQATNRAMVKKWDVKYFPTILFLDEKGEPFYTICGYQPSDVLGDLVKDIKMDYQRGTEYKGGIRWLYDLDEAKSYALLQRRDIFIYITADWSSQCERLEQNTLKNPTVIKELNSEFISLKLDYEKDKELINSLNVLALPTLVILDPSGKEIFRKTGYKDPDELQALLDVEERKKIISIVGHERYREFYRLEALSKLLRRRGLHQSSIDLAQKLLEEFSVQWETYVGIGNSYLALKKPKNAITYYTKALEADAEIDKSFVSNVINVYLQIQDVEGLKRLLDRVINAMSGNISALTDLYLGYSELFEILQDRDQAIQKAKKAVQAESSNFSTHLQLGRLLYYTGKLTESRRHLKTAMRLNAQDPRACFYLGLIAEKEGNLSEKERCFNMAKDRSKEEAWQIFWRYTYEYRMNYYLYPGYLELIEQDYRFVVMLEPENSPAKIELAYFLAVENKDLDEALDLVNSALREDPFDPYYLSAKGTVLIQQGKYDWVNKMASLYEKMIPEQDLESNTALTYFTGKLKLAVGDKDAARFYLEKAIHAKEQDALGMRMQEAAKSLLSQMDK